VAIAGLANHPLQSGQAQKKPHIDTVRKFSYRVSIAIRKTAMPVIQEVATVTFVHQTGNKQLCFIQHIYDALQPGGRAAVVVPDNVLFEGGKGTDIRRDLMDKCNLHTILRLPTGIFYAQGVKTNVLFMQKGTPENKNQDKNCTRETWVYDMRTNMNTFGKRRPLTDAHFNAFIEAYGNDKNGLSAREEGVWQQLGEIENDFEQTIENARWRKFSREYIRDQKGDSLDISWLKDLEASSADNLPEPEVLAGEAMAELTEAMTEIYQLMQPPEHLVPSAQLIQTLVPITAFVLLLHHWHPVPASIGKFQSLLR
jgi:type I restriction enzyme M protein